MDLNPKPFQRMAFEREIQTWVSILSLWQNHIAFLNIRISDLKQKKPNEIDRRQDLQQKISYFADPLIVDYKESLAHHLDDLKNRSNSPIENSWLEEHHLFHRHMRQLKTEYKQMVHKVLDSIEQEI